MPCAPTVRLTTSPCCSSAPARSRPTSSPPGTSPRNRQKSRTRGRLATDQLRAWGLARAEQTTELVVSELVTNAIRHGAPPVQLRLIRDDIARVRGHGRQQHGPPPETVPHSRRTPQARPSRASRCCRTRRYSPHDLA